MPDKKLTDAEIVKALECCHGQLETDCENCPNKNTCDEIDVIQQTLDLINRQKADIKKLTSGKCVYLSDDETTEYCVEGPCPNYKTEAQIKVEAYKEFAKKVNDEISESVYSNHRAITERINEHNANRYEDKICSMWDDQITALVSIRFYIDNLLKEMAGENNA